MSSEREESHVPFAADTTQKDPLNGVLGIRLKKTRKAVKTVSGEPTQWFSVQARCFNGSEPTVCSLARDFLGLLLLGNPRALCENEDETYSKLIS